MLRLQFLLEPLLPHVSLSVPCCYLDMSTSTIDLVFHSRTDFPVTLYDVSYMPDLGFSLFSFHVVQERHEIILEQIRGAPARWSSSFSP